MKERPDDGRDPLVALAAGDPAPFEAFVVRETASFLAFFHHLGAGRSESEDLVQETFLKLFQSADQYRPSGRFTGYAYRVARNAYIDRSRRQASEPSTETQRSAPASRFGVDPLATIADPLQRGPLDEVEAEEQRDRHRRALAALPAGQRIAFQLGVVEGVPYAEVAATLDVPIGTVKSRVFHAVRRLRELLEEPARRGGGRA